MRPKSFVLLALALGCGLVASIGISQVMDKNRQRGNSGVETEAIYVAKVDINLGDPIKAEMINLEEWPKDKIPAGAIRELAELEGRRPRAKIFVGEPILDGKLLSTGEHDNATDTITKGFRVLPISVKADTGGAGLLKPGDRVDVQCFIPRNSGLDIKETTTKTILHNIRVFAVDQTIRRMADGEETATLAKTVSLLVTSKQANILRLADKVGEISLVARNPDDTSTGEGSEASFDDLLGGSRQKSSREKEQGREDSDEKKNDGGGFFGTLLSGLKSNAATAMAQQSAPFRMELISGDEVEERLFSPTTGRPLSDLENGFGGAGIGLPGSATAMPMMHQGNGGLPIGNGLTSDSPGGNDNDFPIDLDEDN